MFKRLAGKKSSSSNKILYSEIPDNKDMELNIKNIKLILSKNSDVIFRDINICGNPDFPVTLVFVDGLVDSKAIGDDVVKPLMQSSLLCKAGNESELIDLIEHGFVYSPDQKTRININDAINDILSGSCALVFDRKKTVLTFDTKGFEKRSITEPTSENAIKGAKDVFVESLRVNTATVRRKIKTQKLVIEQTTIGRQSQTSVSIIYLEGTANKHIVDEVRRRLDSIDIDGVVEAGFVEEYILDKTSTLFPQVLATERPDKFCFSLLEGRVGLLIDGLPIAYDIPAVLGNFLRSTDDYSLNFIAVSFIRLLRYSAAALTLMLPAFYISITTFHQEMIPTELAQAIAASKEGVPFPSFVEVVFMLIAFEILLEAGLRLPRNIGQAVSIVGALVVGEASVNAKLISPAVVVVIALTAISGFTIPNQDFSNAIRLWRFVMVIASSIIGIFGMGMVILFLLYHLASIETFGVPYLSPYVSNEGKDLEDSVIRLPLRFLKKRPSFVRSTNERRQK